MVDRNITIYNPTDEIKAWCRKNLVLPNPEYAKKLRMNKWLGNTPKTISLYQAGNPLILPYGVLNDIKDLCDNQIMEFFPCYPVINYGSAVPLFDYQDKAVRWMMRKQFGILQSPAGSGKTQMGIALAGMLSKPTLWLTHTKDLLEQSKVRAERYMDKSLIGTITEGKVDIGMGITFATVQTMCRLDLTEYRNKWGVVIVDECHRCSGSPTAVTQFYRVLNNLSAKYKYGLSATVHRSDGLIKATYALLGKVVYTVSQAEVADKIMKVGVVPVATGVQLSNDCINSDGTLNYAKLITSLCDNAGRNYKIIQKLCQDETRPTLILSDRLSHLEHLMRMLPPRLQEKAAMISGKMTTKIGKEERRQAIEDMRTGHKTFLFATYSLAKEGLDIPCLERLFMATPQKDYAVITQSIGRVARATEGKKSPLCYDFVDDILYLLNAYKKRCTTYRKNGCYFVEE